MPLLREAKGTAIGLILIELGSLFYPAGHDNVTWSRGLNRGQHLYEDICCQRGQMENLTKLHKAQLASDRMSCHITARPPIRCGSCSTPPHFG
jgi:hypothetical protein